MTSPPSIWQRGGGWVLAQVALMVGVVASAFVDQGSFGGGALQAVAWLLLALGAVFGIGGAWSLRGNRTIYPRPKEDSRLVQTGLYRWVRHPLYTSLMALAVGWALLRGSWTALGTSGVLTAFLHFKAAREERWLRERFPDYPDYAQRVARFLPGVW